MRIKVRNLDGTAYRTVRGTDREIIDRINHLIAVEGWDEAQVGSGYWISLLNEEGCNRLLKRIRSNR